MRSNIKPPEPLYQTFLKNHNFPEARKLFERELKRGFATLGHISYAAFLLNTSENQAENILQSNPESISDYDMQALMQVRIR